MDSFTNDFKNMNLKDKKKKNKHKKNKKDEIKEETPKEELTIEEKFQEEIQQLRNKVTELKLFFAQTKSKNYEQDKIENYQLFENLIDYDKIKQKIIEIFNSQDIYSRLFEIWNKTIEFSKKKNEEKVENKIEEEEDSEESNDKKKFSKNNYLLKIYNKLLMNLNFFTPKIIKNPKEISFKEQICETIFTNLQLIKEIEDGENFLYYFSEIFDIKDLLKNKFISEHKDTTNNFISSYLVFGLNLIKTFDLQEFFPMDKIFKIISDNDYLISYHIYELMVQTYIKNDETKKYIVLDNIFKLLQEDKNIAEYNLVYELINRDFKDDEKKNEIIKKFFSYIKINVEKPINIYTINNTIFYSKLVFQNSELFKEEEINQTKKFICSYFNNLQVKDWRKNLSKLNKFEYNELKDSFVAKNLLEYSHNVPLEKIESFVIILKFLPDEIRKILNKYINNKKYNDGIKLIKMLKLSDEEIPLIFKEEKIKQFFHYKIRVCEEENNPHNLIEYCLLSKQTFDASIKKILNKYYNTDRYNYYYLYVINEIYYGALDKKIKMPKNIKKEIEDIYKGLDYKDKYSFKDYFGPVTKNCMQINPQKTKVKFIDDALYLEKILKQYFINSNYVGIDSEWQQNFKIIDKTQVSIIQISNYEESCCILLDMIELSQKEKFYEIFEKYFKGKIFIGFSFDKSDLGVFPPRLKSFFEDKNNCTIYDVSIIAKQKYLEKISSLKNLTEKIFGKSLCKYEQCSDWNKRPLSQCQMHYGALDALICIMIFKKLMENDIHI